MPEDHGDPASPSGPVRVRHPVGALLVVRVGRARAEGGGGQGAVGQVRQGHVAALVVPVEWKLRIAVK